MKPREHIKSIQRRYRNSDTEFALSSLHGAVDKIQKAFSRYGSFLMEFIQNADDAKSSTVKIEILRDLTEDRDMVRIFNNGDVFSKEDVDSICKIGWSSKTPIEYIGYLGVGFKAVFLISECPEIYSGTYQFRFDRNAWPDPIHTPWQIMPVWIDNSTIQTTKEYSTIFNLPLKEPILTEKIRGEIEPEHLSNRILLFLRNIKKIEITDHIHGFKRKIIKSKFSKTSDYEVYQIQEYENAILKEQGLWLTFRSPCDVPREVKEDLVTREWERESVKKREVMVVFRTNEQNDLLEEERGTAHAGVFSFLPLKEIPSGLNFLIQADFLTTSGRGEFVREFRECLWNSWLADEIYRLIADKCIPIFLKDKQWKFKFTKILYSSEGGHELFESHVKRPLREYLENNRAVIAEDGSIIRCRETVFINPEIRKLMTKDDIAKLYPGKRPLHSECEVPWQIGQWIEKGPTFNATNGPSPEMQKLLEMKAKEENTEFFKKFYREFLLFYKDPSQSTYYRLISHHIIPTIDLGLTNASWAYIKPKDIALCPEIKKSFKIVHPGVTENPEISEYFIKKLSMNELSGKDIQNVIEKEKIPVIREEWRIFSGTEKIEKINLCKKLSEDGLDIRALSFLTLKAKSGKWLAPNELLFPQEYNPDHRIEILIAKRLLDIPLEFVSTEFIKDKPGDEIRKWYEFFKKLGVDEKLEQEKDKNAIVERIGILTALKFERNRRRMAKELGQSESRRGYDIESKSQSEVRYIEVKSRGSFEPDMIITTNELRTLENEQERYFVYVVRDALRHPILCVTHGGKLLDITDIEIIIPFNKWSNEAKEEEFDPDC